MKLQNKNGQYTLTIPKNLVEGMSWKAGDILSFKIGGKDRLELSRGWMVSLTESIMSCFGKPENVPGCAWPFLTIAAIFIIGIVVVFFLWYFLKDRGGEG